MEAIEVSTITNGYLDNIHTDKAQFKVATNCTANCDLTAYMRRGFYKITLSMKGHTRLFYANRGIVIDKPALIFTNPQIPYSWEDVHDECERYFCVFTNQFLHGANRMESIDELSLFKPGGTPVYFLSDEQAAYLYSIFTRMLQEAETDYIYKYDLMRNQLNLIIHEAIKMQPAMAYFNPQNAASRIAKLFSTLLEKQFPVDSGQFSLKLKKASDYADKLAIHVNHLNAAVREVTGKSTTTHINDRILAEARSLLTHTDWTIADIAGSLGFDYASYFNNFFKKHTGHTPLALRKTL
ncbi:helix-turn-helix domain-containing protein [Mucilaginibacter celer]|uniref:Helix-turn-helix domain-containing protein n=1 Tax=Mucilaginibacter celer TaxID=2305508 RepID=A0A494W2W2_9SPHI|nr:helix-turn-helix domain-containing protein [Mucilaginibacter celer]AYL97632.1 helix-turn-helix domain-containing protein [Mucilaginibacter celer]